MDDLASFLETLRKAFNGRTSNNSLMDYMDWDEESYYGVRRKAKDCGYVVLRPGGGGGVVELTQLGSDFSTFTETLRVEFGGQASNITLRRKLDWDDTRYWAIRGHALEHGKITRSRGKGGIVHLVYPAEGMEGNLELFVWTLAETLGGHAGNKRMREELEWNQERYWSVRQVALDQNRIVLGRGGSVRLLQDEQVEERRPERELYPDALRTIQTKWVRQGTYDDYLAVTHR